MAKKVTITDDMATRIAKMYAYTPSTEEAVCRKLSKNKYFFRKAVNRAIIFGLIDDNACIKIAKKADKNYNDKLLKLGYDSSDKVRIFYKKLLDTRESYLSLKMEEENLKDYIETLEEDLNYLEGKLAAAKFSQQAYDDFIASEEETEFKLAEDAAYDIEVSITQKTETKERMEKRLAVVNRELANLTKGVI